MDGFSWLSTLFVLRRLQKAPLPVSSGSIDGDRSPGITLGELELNELGGFVCGMLEEKRGSRDGFLVRLTRWLCLCNAACSKSFEFENYTMGLAVAGFLCSWLMLVGTSDESFRLGLAGVSPLPGAWGWWIVCLLFSWRYGFTGILGSL
nr:hypothetical protein Iba_chr13fCG6010 [Ipomoea batatas]